MSRKLILATALAIILVGMLGLALKVEMVKGSGPIYIRPDGSIDPPTALIQRSGDTYILVGNVTSDTDAIVIERNNMTLDGACYMVQGAGSGAGVLISGRSNVTIKNMKINAFDYGIMLVSSSNSSISANNISSNNYNGVWLYLSSNVSVYGNRITECEYYGIGLDNSRNNSIWENTITDNEGGLYLDWSSNNIVVANNVTASTYSGIRLQVSSNNTLRRNIVADNLYNFEVFGENPSDLVNYVDVSNTVDGKPVYYLINERDRIVPADAGYVALVNCTRIIVQNLNLTNNGKGVTVASTINSTVIGNKISNNAWGIWLLKSYDIRIAGNNITANSYYGVDFAYSSNNSISANHIRRSYMAGIRSSFSSHNSINGNDITNNDGGIEVRSSSNSSVVDNNIANNEFGIKLYGSSYNKIYHNNFLDNAQQVDTETSSFANAWDGGYQSGGNYWSDYSELDLNHDGIGDFPYEIESNNADHYPLCGMFYSFNTSLELRVEVVSNSTIEGFEYFGLIGTIKMYVSSLSTLQTYGFCRICIPYELMNVTNIQVVIDDGGIPVLYPNYTLHGNGTHVWIYFAYERLAHEIDIIPEFSSLRIISVYMAVTIFAVIVYRRKTCPH